MKFKPQYYDDFVGMVASLAVRHYPSSQYDFADIIQAGWLGLSKACKSFDKKRNVPLPNLAYLCIRSEILKAVFRKGVAPSKEHSGYDEDFYDKLKTELNSPLEELLKKEDEEIKIDKYDRIIKTLNAKNYVLDKCNGLNRRIFKDYYLKNMKMINIAEKYGLSLAGCQRRVGHVKSILKLKLGVITEIKTYEHKEK